MSLAQAAGARAPDTVALTFRWPALTRARVEARRYSERHGDGKHDTVDVRMTYRMTAKKAATGYLLQFSDFRAPSEPADTLHDAATVAMLNAFVPSYRVSQSGEFIALESPETVQSRVREWVQSRSSRAEPLSEQAEQLIRHYTSSEVLAQLAAEDWNELVGSWFDTKFEIGATYESESVEPYAILPGAEILMRYRFRAARRLACDSVKAPAIRDCVELRMTSSPDSAALRQLLDRLLSQLAPDSTDMRVTSMSMVTDITLIARPESLLPIQITRSKKVAVTGRDGTGKSETSDNVDVRTRRFTYEQ